MLLLYSHITRAKVTSKRVITSRVRESFLRRSVLTKDHSSESGMSRSKVKDRLIPSTRKGIGNSVQTSRRSVVEASRITKTQAMDLSSVKRNRQPVTLPRQSRASIMRQDWAKRSPIKSGDETSSLQSKDSTRISRSSPIHRVTRASAEMASKRRSNSLAPTISKNSASSTKDVHFNTKKESVGKRNSSLKPTIPYQTSVRNNPRTKLLRAIQEASELIPPQRKQKNTESSSSSNINSAQELLTGREVLKMEEVVRRTESLTSSQNVDNLASLLANHTKNLSNHFASADAHTSLYKTLATSGDERDKLEISESNAMKSVPSFEEAEYYQDDFVPESREQSRDDHATNEVALESIDSSALQEPSKYKNGNIILKSNQTESLDGRNPSDVSSAGMSSMHIIADINGSSKRGPSEDDDNYEDAFYDDVDD